MEAWDVVVVGGTVAGLRAAVAAADSAATVTILEEGALGGAAGNMTVESLAVSANEANPSNHASDTISAGCGIADEQVVTTRTASAFPHLSQLEQWGLNLRRAADGSPHLSTAPGHSTPRLASTGDTTGREVHTVLEEQCMKRNIPRRGDIQVLSLVTEGGAVTGLIGLDVQQGELFSMKAKSIILATDGMESLWNGGSGGSGLWLAQSAGVILANMEFAAWDVMSMEVHGLSLPYPILADGAAVRPASGGEVSLAAEGGMFKSMQAVLQSGERCVLDARVLDRGVAAWYGDTSERVHSRLSGDMNETVIPLGARVRTTLGGIPCSYDGKAVGLEGLFVAGDCACSGFHGADMLVGNRLLESLDGGEQAGRSAGRAAETVAFSTSNAILGALGAASRRFAAIRDDTDGGVTRGQAATRLNEMMTEAMGVERDASTLHSTANRLADLAGTPITLSDHNPLMNTELVEVFRLKGMLQVAQSAFAAAQARHEPCGSHNIG